LTALARNLRCGLIGATGSRLLEQHRTPPLRTAVRTTRALKEEALTRSNDFPPLWYDSLFRSTEQAMKMIGLPGHMVFGREEGVMNTTSTLLKKSLQWSIALSVLMIAAGVLAIVVPGLRGWP
jgi:hypothetical protein